MTQEARSQKADAERNAFIESNIRLAHWAVIRFMRARPGIERCYDKDMAYSDACFGLFRAAEKFDKSLGFQFSTYARFWMYQAMQRGLRAVHVISVPRAKIVSLRKTLRLYFRFNGKDCERDIYDKSPTPEDLAELSECQERILRCLRKLIPRDAEIVMRRASGDTLEEISASIGVTRERVRQIENRGLKNLKYWIKRLEPELSEG